VIARIWFGRTRPEHFDEYAAYVEETGLRGLSATAGNQGAYLFRRLVDDEAEFLVLSLWESLDAIRAFAGDEIDTARYYPDDKRFLLAFEPKVQHYGAQGAALRGLGSR
jgi:heme-degrading monooxygenase HmoA